MSEAVGIVAQVREALDALRRALGALEPRVLDATAATRLVELLAQGEHVCAAEKARVARRVDETGAYRERGHRSSAHWRADATGVTVGAAMASLRTAERLDALPTTAEAFRSGLLSETQANAISLAASADPASESRLLAAAKRSSVKGLKDRCREVAIRAADAAAIDRGWVEPGERCDVDGLGPIPVTTSRSLLDDAKIRVAVREGTEITTISGVTRTIPAALRAWLKSACPACERARNCEHLTTKADARFALDVVSERHSPYNCGAAIPGLGSARWMREGCSDDRHGFCPARRPGYRRLRARTGPVAPLFQLP